MAENRTPREVEVRAKEVRKSWRPASALPDVNPHPGWRYHWVMTHLMGESQGTNVSQKFREGYEPVKASDHPELEYEKDKNGNIVVGGLMLCRMPEEMAEERDKFYNQRASTQANAVHSTYLSQQADSRMPLFVENSQKASVGNFGNGS
jgi:hypothetical protein